jgi:N-ethylmaleimide reductase
MLFEPFEISGLHLKNRVVQSALTRLRAEIKTGNPTPMMKIYYEQRAESAGMIISEALSISPSSSKNVQAPGIYNESHVSHWKEITDMIHSHGRYIFAQLAHYGRIVHPEIAEDRIPISSSAGGVSGQTRTYTGKKDFVPARAMEDEDFKEVIGDFVRAAQNAKQAGFDGIEIHAAHGLLIAQFLNTSINKRTDKYGGSVENRSRFLLEIVDAVLSYWTPDRIIVKLSFVGRNWGEFNENPVETMQYVLSQLQKRNIQFADLLESDPKVKENNGSLQIFNVANEARKHFKNTIITNGFRPVEERIRKIQEGEADLVAFGELFVSNPDLVHRLQHNLPLAAGTPATYYEGEEKGYIDYLPYEAQKPELLAEKL